MVAKKNAIKKPRKKKAKNLFANDSNIKAKLNEYQKLHVDKRKIEVDIQSIVDDYNGQTINGHPENFLEALPLETLADLQNFSEGKSPNFSMNVLKARSQLRKDRAKKVEELESINKKIHENNIDLVLAKIECLIGEIKEDNK